MPGAPQIPWDKAALAMELGDLGHASPAIAPIVGVSERSIRDIIAQHGRWGEVAQEPVFAELRRAQSKVLEAGFRAGAAKYLERSFDESKLEKASTYQLVMCAAVAVDKAQLLAGLPTENIAVSVQATIAIDDLSSRLSQRLVDK